MADLAISTTISLVDPGQAETYDAIPVSTVTVGQAVHFDPTTGKIAAADANAAGDQQFAGIVVKVTGRAATVLKRGRVYGFNLSGMNYFAPAYVSDTAGSLADGAGTLTVNAGKVVPVAESGGPVKALYIDADWLRVWS